MTDPNFPWTGLLIGGTIVGIWYWCTDQYIVQRTLAANNITIARRGAIFGAYLKLLPILIFLVPGIIAFALTIQQPDVFVIERADRAFPMLVKTLLPVGLKGLVAGGLMAALMSSLASVFNSCSTIFTIDIYKKIRPEKSEKSLINIGKIATTIIVIMGIMWIPIMDKIGGGVMYQYLQNVQSYIAPPVTAVFLLGILWKRMTSDAAIATLFSGLILLISRLGSEIYFQEEILSGESISGIAFTFATINFAHMAIFMFIFSIFVCVGVSLLSARPDYARIKGLSFGTMTPDMKEEYQNSFNRADLILSMILIGLVVSVLLYFTG
jgi:SSS family solute:Na+ symporter